MASLRNKDLKLTYFNARIKGEPIRLLLAFGGYEYTDERIPPPWEDLDGWLARKPSYSWGHLPCLTIGGEMICESMAICRYLAREMGLSGKTSLENAMMDEIVDVVQDVFDKNYKAWYSPNKKEALKELTEVTFPTAMAQLEKKLVERGGQFFAGNSLTFADLHVFYFLAEAEFMCPIVVKQYPKLSGLVDRIASNPNIRNYIETRPPKTKENEQFMIYFKNAFQIISLNILEDEKK